MGISIDDAIKHKIISTEAISIIPKKCSCGSVFELDNTARFFKCSNKNCTNIIRNNVAMFCDKLGIKISNSTINNIINELNIVSPYQILMLDKAVEQGIITIPEDCKDITYIVNKPIYLYQIAEMYPDEDISKIARTLIYGFNSFEDFYDEIDKCQVTFIKDRLGIKGADGTALALLILDKLTKYREQFIFAETILNVVKHENVINIAFSDNILPYINSLEFTDVLNSKYNYTFNIVTNIHDSTDILVKNFTESNQKYKKAQRINEKYVADMMNNNKMQLSDINKFNSTDIKPIGNKCWITTTEQLVKRLDELGDYSYE